MYINVCMCLCVGLCVKILSRRWLYSIKICFVACTNLRDDKVLTKCINKLNNLIKNGIIASKQLLWWESEKSRHIPFSNMFKVYMSLCLHLNAWELKPHIKYILTSLQSATHFFLVFLSKWNKIKWISLVILTFSNRFPYYFVYQLKRNHKISNVI